MKSTTLILCTAALLTLSGCATTIKPLQTVQTTQITGNCQLKDVHDALIDAAIYRGWSIKDNGNDSLDATLAIRTHKIEVKLDYTPNEITTTYVSSINMDEKDGKIHKKYYNWTNNLVTDAKKKLKTICK